MLTRRQALQSGACGLASIAMADLLGEAGAVAPPRRAGRARRVIFLFMQGGPSQVDTFDYKPRLGRDDGKHVAFDDPRIRAMGGMPTEHRVMKSLWRFAPRGESGLWVSDLLPCLAREADRLCVLRGMHTEGSAHGLATMFLHTGSTNLVRPAVGSWALYGLGALNRDLPGFVSICPSMGKVGPRAFGSAFLPAIYQGTPLGRAGLTASHARLKNLDNPELTRAEQRAQLDLLQSFNAEQAARSAGDAEADAVIDSFELAFRMQARAPVLFDLSREPRSVQAMYGIGEKATDDFGRQCLLARRLSEAGVRYVQVTYGDNSDQPAWDQHHDISKHADHARATDRPVAALLHDLAQRGLLEDTLVWWGGEFGRTPYAQKNGKGRDHNPQGFTMWLAGGGVKAGFAYGATDDFGQTAIQGKVHMHDLHATILHLLGLDHEKLTYRWAGRDFRLTDVHGRVVHELLA